ncbi:MAG: SDR family oxidoreductase [Chlamydiota bacterium]|jgi:NADP-dependent 3-hydroxy acid dehydrogenase YdfG
MKAIIISASSDIGTALAKDWSENGWEVFGTYRTYSKAVENLETNFNMRLVHCDLLDKSSVQNACENLVHQCSFWDALIIAPGHLEPIGDFKDLDFNEWEKGIQLNLLQQLRILHQLLPYRNLGTNQEPCVLFFAGGGTNNAVLHYSSYTLSKIALIKMCELLDAEIPDTRFVIVGPGLVKTKIHEPTLRLGEQTAGDNYKRIVKRLENEECTSMEDVIKCCTYLITTPCKSIRGRNFSVISDKWNTKELEKELETDANMYKLRRYKNT